MRKSIQLAAFICLTLIGLPAMETSAQSCSGAAWSASLVTLTAPTTLQNPAGQNPITHEWHELNGITSFTGSYEDEELGEVKHRTYIEFTLSDNGKFSVMYKTEGISDAIPESTSYKFTGFAYTDMNPEFFDGVITLDAATKGTFLKKNLRGEELDSGETVHQFSLRFDLLKLEQSEVAEQFSPICQGLVLDTTYTGSTFVTVDGHEFPESYGVVHLIRTTSKLWLRSWKYCQKRMLN